MEQYHSITKCQANGCNNEAEVLKKESYNFEDTDSKIHEYGDVLFSIDVLLCQNHAALQETNEVNMSFHFERLPLTA